MGTRYAFKLTDDSGRAVDVEAETLTTYGEVCGGSILLGRYRFTCNACGEHLVIEATAGSVAFEAHQEDCVGRERCEGGDCLDCENRAAAKASHDDPGLGDFGERIVFRGPCGCAWTVNEVVAGKPCENGCRPPPPPPSNPLDERSPIERAWARDTTSRMQHGDLRPPTKPYLTDEQWRARWAADEAGDDVEVTP